MVFYDKRMRDLIDLKLFIDLDYDIRLSRRIYRDIISRGREMETVLERYHKFVKTAYNNFIRPTKEYADIIIPRGGSNTIAIDLINYHLKYLVGNVIFKNDKEITVEKIDAKEKEDNEITIKKEYVDNPETINKLGTKDIFCEDKKKCLIKKEEEDMFLDMFKSYLKNEKSQYYDLYIDIYISKIKDAYEKDDLIIFSNDDLSKVELNVKERIKKLKKENDTFNVFYFIPFFFDNYHDKKLQNVLEFLKGTKEINDIKIVSVFADSDKFSLLDKSNSYKTKAIYSGEKIKNYKEFIENLGFYSKMDDENSNNLISLSTDNFERRFLGLIEAENKKDNLSIINNSKEED